MSPVTRREQSRNETNALIIQTARKLFRENGFEETPTRAIAEQAGVAVGTLFKHFPDKDALLSGILLVELDEVLDATWATLPEAPLLPRLMHFAHALYTFYAQDPKLSRALVRATTFSPGPASEAAQSQILQFMAGVTQLIEQARQHGELRPDLDALPVARVFFATYLMVLMEHLSRPEFDPEAARETLLHALQGAYLGWRQP